MGIGIIRPRRWQTVWDDGTLDRTFWTYRFADHRRWGINYTAAAMGSERTLRVRRIPTGARVLPEDAA